MRDHVDIMIVGAGLSGIGAAWHLQQNCPNKSYAILEARDAIGGTWDLFRYPGVRSDSDMFTLGYSFKPWRGEKSIAAGADIAAYIREAADEHGINRNIRFGHRLRRASWSTPTQRWHLDVGRADGTTMRLSCGFLLMCSGYYRYDGGYRPSFPAMDTFKGRVVHPQNWTDDIVTAGKRVVIIGSGATAVTLAPAIADSAAHVTMLQRSPTYIVPWPETDLLAQKLRRRFKPATAYRLTRAKNVLRGMYFYRAARRNPELAKARMLGLVREQLGPEYNLDPDFTPTYNPWDQRVCLSPNADFFSIMKSGKASVVTDQIDTFTPTGIRLISGRHLDADLIVTATGLVLQFLGGVAVDVDGRPVEAPTSMVYKGVMFRDVPNLVTIFGYVNASWTLKSDLVAAYVCRLLNHMDGRNARVAVPHDDDPTLSEQPWTHFSSGYFQRAADQLPRQGSRKPWLRADNYLTDIMMLRFGRIDDGVMCFSTPVSQADTAAPSLQRSD